MRDDTVTSLALGIALIGGMLLGLIVGVGTGTSNRVPHKDIIAAGCGHYDAKTGEFTLGVSDE